MPIFVRTRPNRPGAELRVKHKLLPKLFYATLSNEAEARQYGERLHRSLERGIVPEELQPKAKFDFDDVAGAIDQYVASRDMPRSRRTLLATIRKDIGSTKLRVIDYAWAESWVSAQKIQHHRSPGTIRKQKGALQLCLKWVCNYHPGMLAVNPLPELEPGYSRYSEAEAQLLLAKGLEPKVDLERDRRLKVEEEKAVLDCLQRRIDGAQDVAARSSCQAMLVMFLLALGTAMRLREMYTLSAGQVDLPRKTIFLKRTKNGDTREVPMSSAILRLMAEVLARMSGSPKELLFPFWNGDLSEEVLDSVSADISAAYAEIFEEAGCPDFHFHDTRHEATCRLVLLETPGKPRLDAVQISKITGHKDPRMLRRYMSLRGSELAEFLG